MNRKEQIWNFVHYVKTELTKEEREINKFSVTGSDNYYMVRFINHHPANFDKENYSFEFKIEKNYRLSSDSMIHYTISHIWIGKVSDIKNISVSDQMEFLYNHLIPYIRQYKIDRLGL